MLQAVLDHLWTHESSRVPGASYIAPGPEFQGVDQNFRPQSFRETGKILTTIYM